MRSLAKVRAESVGSWGVQGTLGGTETVWVSPAPDGVVDSSLQSGCHLLHLRLSENMVSLTYVWN